MIARPAAQTGTSTASSRAGRAPRELTGSCPSALAVYHCQPVQPPAKWAANTAAVARITAKRAFHCNIELPPQTRTPDVVDCAQSVGEPPSPVRGNVRKPASIGRLRGVQTGLRERPAGPCEPFAVPPGQGHERGAEARRVDHPAVADGDAHVVDLRGLRPRALRAEEDDVTGRELRK